MRKLKLLQVGLGPWGQDWAQNVLPQAATVTVVGGVDTDPSRLAESAPGSGIPGFTDLADALSSTDAEAVLITARIEAHFAIAAQALRAGKHVLTEKPFTVTVDEAAELNALAERNGLALCVAQNYRFWPVVAAVSRLIEHGDIGRMLNARIVFRRDHGSYGPALAAPSGSATGSVLYQISVHHFDLVRAVLGEISHVRAQRWNRGNPAGRLVAFSSTLTLNDGTYVEYSANQVSKARETPWSGAWTIEGEDGVIHWGGNATASPADAYLRLVLHSGDAVHVPIEELEESDRQAVLREFMHVVRGRSDSGISGASNINTLRAIDEASRSMGTGA